MSFDVPYIIFVPYVYCFRNSYIYTIGITFCVSLYHSSNPLPERIYHEINCAPAHLHVHLNVKRWIEYNLNELIPLYSLLIKNKKQHFDVLFSFYGVACYNFSNESVVIFQFPAMLYFDVGIPTYILYTRCNDDDLFLYTSTSGVVILTFSTMYSYSTFMSTYLYDIIYYYGAVW